MTQICKVPSTWTLQTSSNSNKCTALVVSQFDLGQDLTLFGDLRLDLNLRCSDSTETFLGSLYSSHIKLKHTVLKTHFWCLGGHSWFFLLLLYSQLCWADAFSTFWDHIKVVHHMRLLCWRINLRKDKTVSISWSFSKPISAACLPQWLALQPCAHCHRLPLWRH